MMSPPMSPASSMKSPSTSSGASGGALAPSYLHMFKSSGADERELERLEINDESVAYLADGEVGGRRNVVKFEGILRRRPSVSSGKEHAHVTHTEEPAGGEEGKTTSTWNADD